MMLQTNLDVTKAFGTSSGGGVGFLIVLVAVVLAAGLRAQTVEPNSPAADELLKEVDSRIYYPRLAGVTDFSCRWQLGGTGPFVELESMWIAYAWKAPGKLRMQYVRADGTPFAEFPEFIKTEQGAALLKYLEGSLHGLVQSIVLGLPLSEIYADYYKEVTTTEVNNKLRHRVTMRPKSKKSYSRVVLEVRDGLPVEFTKTDTEGRDLVTRVRFEKRGDKFLIKGMKVEQNNQVTTDEEYHYVMKGDLLIVGSVERGIMIPEPRKVMVRLEDLKVNSGLSDELFETK